MARTETRHHDISSHERARWAADVQDVAERARRWREARDAYRPTGERLKTLRHAHAVIVELIAKRAGVTIGHPGAVPDGLDVPRHRELVEEIHALACDTTRLAPASSPFSGRVAAASPP